MIWDWAGLGWKCFKFKGENFCFIRDLGLAGGDGCGPRFFFNFKLYWTRTRRVVEIVWVAHVNFLPTLMEI